MSYKLKFEKNALKSLIKMDTNQRIILMAWIQKNLDQCENPRSHGKALSGKLNNYWSYRFGDYRVIVEITKDEVVLVNISLRDYSDIIEKFVNKSKTL